LVKNGKFKIQMADDGVPTTSTKLTDTDPGHGHATQTLSEGTDGAGLAEGQISVDLGQISY